MTTTTLTAIKNGLNINNYLPSGIDMDTRLTLTDAKAANYQYWGHKYAEGNENYQNVAVALQFNHSMVEKSFWIVFFKGAQYRESDAQFVQAYWTLPTINDAIYQDRGIEEMDHGDGVETILDIVAKFDRLWFSGDDVDESQYVIIEDNCEALSEMAEVILEELNLVVNISVPLEFVQPHHIDEIKLALAKAKESYRMQKGKEIIKSILDDDNAPKELKSFITEKKIFVASIEHIVLSEDYMPEWGHMLNLHNEETIYSFRLASSESFTDEYDPENIDSTFYIEDELRDFLNLVEETSSSFWDYLLTKVYMANLTEDFITKP